MTFEEHPVRVNGRRTASARICLDQHQTARESHVRQRRNNDERKGSQQRPGGRISSWSRNRKRYAARVAPATRVLVSFDKCADDDIRPVLTSDGFAGSLGGGNWRGFLSLCRTWMETYLYIVVWFRSWSLQPLWQVHDHFFSTKMKEDKILLL